MKVLKLPAVNFVLSVKERLGKKRVYTKCQICVAYINIAKNNFNISEFLKKMIELTFMTNRSDDV